MFQTLAGACILAFRHVCVWVRAYVCIVGNFYVYVHTYINIYIYMYLLGCFVLYAMPMHLRICKSIFVY